MTLLYPCQGRANSKFSRYISVQMRIRFWQSPKSIDLLTVRITNQPTSKDLKQILSYSERNRLQCSEANCEGGWGQSQKLSIRTTEQIQAEHRTTPSAWDAEVWNERKLRYVLCVMMLYGYGKPTALNIRSRLTQTAIAY